MPGIIFVGYNKKAQPLSIRGGVVVVLLVLLCGGANGIRGSQNGCWRRVFIAQSSAPNRGITSAGVSVSASLYTLSLPAQPHPSRRTRRLILQYRTQRRPQTRPLQRRPLTQYISTGHGRDPNHHVFRTSNASLERRRAGQTAQRAARGQNPGRRVCSTGQDYRFGRRCLSRYVEAPAGLSRRPAR